MKKEFIEYIKKEFGFDDEEISKFEESLKIPLKKSIRINTNKISIKDFHKRAETNNWQLTKTEYGKNIFYIDRENAKEIALGNTPEHISGYFYVQEVSASTSPFYMSGDNIDNGEYLILDMSASPGGKTTGLQEYYPNSLIVANELDKSRLKGFFLNLDRMSSLGVVATNYDGRFFKQTPEIFDKILLDAPCSGEGTAFKTDDALKYWNLKNIKNIAKLQFGLLESAIKAIKPGGEIVYSTCTLNKFENEGVIEKILKKYGEFIEIVPISKEFKFMRNWPHLNFTGGFFVAKIRKTKSIESKKEIRFVRQNIEKLNNTIRKKIEQFFSENFDFSLKSFYLYSYNGDIQLTNRNLDSIWDKIFLYKIGINIGNIKSGEFVPNFYAGSFIRFNKNILNVNKQELYKLLSGYEIQKDLKDGYYQIIYDNLEMGIIKTKNGNLKSLISHKINTN